MSHLVVGFLALLAAAAPSEFARFPPENPLVGPPKAPVLRTSEARRYRTVLRGAASEGPDFNGHYKVVHWGCGTNCIVWAVINLESGDVWVSPKPVSSCLVSLATEETEVPDWIVARLDSSLLYVHSCEDPDNGRALDTRHVFVWDGHSPRWLRDERLEKLVNNFRRPNKALELAVSSISSPARSSTPCSTHLRGCGERPGGHRSPSAAGSGRREVGAGPEQGTPPSSW